MSTDYLEGSQDSFPLLDVMEKRGSLLLPSMKLFQVADQS